MKNEFDTNSNNIVQKDKKHGNASFVRPKKLTKIEKRNQAMKIKYQKEKLELQKLIEQKIEETEKIKLKNGDTSIIPTISLNEFKNDKKERFTLKELSKKDIDKTAVIPTISLDEYLKNGKPKKEGLFSKIIKYLNKKKHEIELKSTLKKKNAEKNKSEKLEQEKLESEKSLIKKRLLEEKKLEKKNKKQIKSFDGVEQEKLINSSQLNGIVNEKKKNYFKSIIENIKTKRQKEKELRRSKSTLKKQEMNSLKIQKEEQKKQIKLKRLEENKKKQEEKAKKRLARDEKRKEKLKLEVEEQVRKQKEKEEKIILLNNERKEKQKKIKQEREEARKQRKEKLKLIKQAQEESKQKEKSERKTLEEKIKDWYNNLNFVRDRKNRRELQRQTLLIDFDGADAVRSEEKVMYKYVAKKNDTGKVETGYFAAFSKLDVHSFLIAEGYEVYEITPQKNFAKSLSLVSPKFNSTELDFFLTQLSTFLKSGITLIDSVKILSKQCKKNSQKNVYKSLIYELSMGENFSEALSKQGTIFPRLLVNMVKTSELTGDLPETLDDMANYYKEMEKTRKQMISAITYPAVVLVFAFTILIFIMVSVIPQFVGIYKDLGTDLPGITVAIINISSFLQSYWFYVVLGVIVFIVLFIVLFKSIKVFKTVIQSLVMNVPVFGKIIIYNEVTMFTKTFASLLNHNVYITDCMEVLSKITNNEIYKMLIFDTITNLAKGEAISNSFKNHWAFPTIAYEMILTGEKTGQLGVMMQKVSDYYQELHKNAVNQIKAFIEPVMIVVLAGIVGVVLLSVILPMFDMYQNIG